MTRFTLLAGVTLLTASLVGGAGPTTEPFPPPAVAVTGAPAGYSSVLVLPFAPVAGASDWIGKGIQEDLATELVRQSRLDVLTPADAQPVSDAATAMHAGRDKGASLVVFGTYQIQDTDVRINGQLIDTASGKPLAALKVTGPRRDLFHMEDALAAQAVASLPPAAIKLGGGAYASNNEGIPPAAPAGTINSATSQYNAQGYYVTPGPVYTPSYDYGSTSYPADTGYYGGYTPYTTAYPYDYGYGYPYGYDYPFWGDGFLFLGGFGGYGRGYYRGHDHGHDGRWYNGTESHHVGGFGGVAARSPEAGEVSAVRSSGEGRFARSVPEFRGSVSGGGGFRSGGGFGGLHGGGFGGGFHGGGGGHR